MGTSSEQTPLNGNDEANESLATYYEILDIRAAEKEKGFHGHTMRRNVSYPDHDDHNDRGRTSNGGGKVRDNYHYPATKTWRWKGDEDSCVRQWLKRQRKYQKHCERRKRKEATRSQSKSETDRNPA